MTLRQLIEPTAKSIRFSHRIYGYYLIAIIFLLLSVLYIDRPLAEYLYQLKPHPPLLTSVFLVLSKIPLILEVLAGIIVLTGLFSRYKENIQQVIKPIIYVVITASIIRVSAKVLFGRTWPETWTNNNPSWIEHGIEAFHPLSISQSYHSFPSGHALFTFALASLFWYFSPRLYWLWLTMMSGVFIGQLAQNYHYLGDLLAGAILGTLITQLVVGLFDKRKSTK